MLVSKKEGIKKAHSFSILKNAKNNVFDLLLLVKKGIIFQSKNL
jgi:hypothetical protein